MRAALGNVPFRLAMVLVALLASFGVSVAAAPMAHAACRSEPFAGDVYTYGASHASINIDTGQRTWVVPAGTSSDSVIPSGYCEDVDYWYLPSYHDAFRLDGRLGWVRMETSTGWHQIHGENISRALFYCPSSPYC